MSCRYGGIRGQYESVCPVGMVKYVGNMSHKASCRQCGIPGQYVSWDVL